jgi:2-polyprenyl-3-methyl-5-hydroxy-6-metoxy-1,4-benzoquinol methylase
VGVQPLYGLHLPLCLIICLPFRLDVLLAYAAANISNPLLAPLIVLTEIQLGSLVLDGKLLAIHLSQLKERGAIHLAAQLGIGAVLLGVILSAIGGILAAQLAHFAKRNRDRKESRSGFQGLADAIHRTRLRYTSARASDRHYVANKLRFDPIVRTICEMKPHLGDVVDVGCGRGQLGLALYELGQIHTLRGFDWDERKVDTARVAAGDDALYTTGDVQTAPIPEADTILIVDVLHYLSPVAQDALLKRAAASLRPEGMLIVRDIDARRTLSSLFAQLCERLSIYFKMNRGTQLTFSSCQRHSDALGRHGLHVTDTIPMPGLFLDNVLLLAVRSQDPAIDASN